MFAASGLKGPPCGTPFFPPALMISLTRCRTFGACTLRAILPSSTSCRTLSKNHSTDCPPPPRAGYPKQVTIVRPRHAFEGQSLEVLGWLRRDGELQLTLVLPDGTRSLIPAAWTDLQTTQTPAHDGKPPQPALLASCTQLLHAR